MLLLVGNSEKEAQVSVSRCCKSNLVKITFFIATDELVTFVLPRHVALSEYIQDCAQVQVIEVIMQWLLQVWKHSCHEMIIAVRLQQDDLNKEHLLCREIESVPVLR